MREYKFRGMTKLGTWRFGCLTDYQTKHTVTNESGGEFFINGHEVIPETVGLSFNNPDKHGQEMFDGDIVIFRYFYFDGYGEAEGEIKGVLKFDTYGWAIHKIVGKHWEEYTGCESGEDNTYILAFFADGLYEESFEVIGNIHEDNNEKQ